MTVATSVPSTDRPFWDPASGRFDGAALRGAVVARRWTVREFAQLARISNACLYNALGSRGVSDRTAIRIFETLAKREPMMVAWSTSASAEAMAFAPSRHHM